ncbi:hypothetical protein EX30DRAFT_344770 [Ascodesmis nigricans]|uniref:N-acetyltransferase domain-containing protein n=1 Tax=Ascodesmis nigricans TaxID=341454 RepID=A0A4S2MII1_9PEZI|nr:hypothetical protein EX30DRAFT_344770 [Ascodesmis nigricans]
MSPTPSPTSDIPTSTLIPLHYLLSSPSAPSLHLISPAIHHILQSFPEFQFLVSRNHAGAVVGEAEGGEGATPVGEGSEADGEGEAHGEGYGDGGGYEGGVGGVAYFTHASPDTAHTIHRVFLTSPNALDSSRIRSLIERLLVVGEGDRVVVNSYDPRIRELRGVVNVGVGCDEDGDGDEAREQGGRRRVRVHELVEMSLIPGGGADDVGNGRESEGPESVFHRAGVQIRREEVAGEIAFYLTPLPSSSSSSSSPSTIAAKLLLLPSPFASASPPPTHRRKIYISALRVSPSHQRRGLATALLHYAMHRLPEFAGCEWVWTVFCENLPAIRLYQRIGATRRKEGELWVVTNGV